jgi:hypothetical protein
MIIWLPRLIRREVHRQAGKREVKKKNERINMIQLEQEKGEKKKRQ